MTFDEVLARSRAAAARGRVTYRALKRRFALDDDYLEDLKGELISAEGWRWMKMARCWSGRAEQRRAKRRKGEAAKKRKLSVLSRQLSVPSP